MPRIFWQPEPVTTDFDRCFQYAGIWGFDGIELRTLGSPDERVPDIREPVLNRRLVQSEMTVVASDPGFFDGYVEERALAMNELERLRDVIALNRRLDIDRILVGSFGEQGVPDPALYLKGAERASAAGQRLVVKSSDPDRLIHILDDVEHGSVGSALEVDPQFHADLSTGHFERMELIRFTIQLNEKDLDEFEARILSSWKGVLDQAAARGFNGDFCLEMATDDPGRVGLKVATALIHGVRTSFS